MLATIGFMVYQVHFIKTHSRRQIIIAWLALGLVFAIALMAILTFPPNPFI